MNFNFGDLRSAGELKDKEDGREFFELLVDIHGDPGLRVVADGWIDKLLSRRIDCLRWLPKGENKYVYLNALLRFLLFDSFTVGVAMNDIQLDKLRSREVRLDAGLKNISLCVSEDTKSVVCLGFGDKDVLGLVDVLNRENLSLDRLKFYKGDFRVDSIGRLDGVFNGKISGLEIFNPGGPSFVDHSLVRSGRFDFLQNSTISSLSTFSVIMSGEDGNSVGRVLASNPDLESMKIDFGIVDDSFMLNLALRSDGLSFVKEFEVNSCGISDFGMVSLIELGFFRECQRLGVYNCFDLSEEMILRLPLMIPSLNELELDVVVRSRVEKIWSNLKKG